MHHDDSIRKKCFIDIKALNEYVLLTAQNYEKKGKKEVPPTEKCLRDCVFKGKMLEAGSNAQEVVGL